MLFPGEPAPPGYEDEVNTVTFLEPVASKQLKPLIGLEYVVELFDNKAKEPFYVCTLCDKRCDPRNIIAQITSHRHRMKYLVRNKNNNKVNFRFPIFVDFQRKIKNITNLPVNFSPRVVNTYVNFFAQFEKSK